MENWTMLCHGLLLLMTLLKICAAEECNGQQSFASIPATSFTSSSFYNLKSENLNAQGSRINATIGWSALTNSENKPWIQADLGSCRTIKKVVTQGRGNQNDQWVTKYSLGFSTDGNTWTSYEEPAGTVKVFDANTGSGTDAEKVTNTLSITVTTRFVRLYVEEFSTWPSLRWDVISCDPECNGEQSFASIPSTSLTSSSFYNLKGENLNAQGSRIDAAIGWSALTNSEKKPWIQADLGSCRTIKKVVTQGRGNQNDQWVTKYSLGFSTDGDTWTSYEEPAGTVKVFDANTGSGTDAEKVTNTLSITVTARFVRLYVEEFSTWPSLRWDVMSC